MFGSRTKPQTPHIIPDPNPRGGWDGAENPLYGGADHRKPVKEKAAQLRGQIARQTPHSSRSSRIIPDPSPKSVFDGLEGLWEEDCLLPDRNQGISLTIGLDWNLYIGVVAGDIRREKVVLRMSRYVPYQPTSNRIRCEAPAERWMGAFVWKTNLARTPSKGRTLTLLKCIRCSVWMETITHILAMRSCHRNTQVQYYWYRLKRDPLRSASGAADG